MRAFLGTCSGALWSNNGTSVLRHRNNTVEGNNKSEDIYNRGMAYMEAADKYKDRAVNDNTVRGHIYNTEPG